MLLRVALEQRSAEMVWFACVSYAARSTTNNMVEYLGLVHGLRQAMSHKMAPLHVCGDSQLILHQLSKHRVPAAPHLRRHYYSACRNATRHGVRS